MKEKNNNGSHVENYLRELSLGDSRLNFVLVYIAYIVSINKLDDINQFFSYVKETISEQRELFVKEIVGGNFEIAFQLSKIFSDKELLDFLFKYPREDSKKSSSMFETPNSLSRLALRLLDIKEGERVADFGSGVGDFISVAVKKNINSSFYGIELNSYSYEISKIRSELFMHNAEFELGDMLEIPKTRKFEKIFSNYPFGMRLASLQTETVYIADLYGRMPEIQKATSSDWVFNSLIIDHLSESGKAVAIMTNGSTWNSTDQKIREYFVRKGYVEAVIALPQKLFDFTSIPTTMIVLSKGNDSVKMIDATTICEQGRRQNTISNENLEQIVTLFNENSDKVFSATLNMLEKNDFVLYPSKYLIKEVDIENGVEFGSLMKRITRGAQIKASILDEMVSENATNTQYVMLSNIQDGMISEELPYLKNLDSKFDRYCIQNRNLLLSKNGAPFKIAVAEVEEGKKLLGNGNLFIIELDEEKVNPYFIEAFFDSEFGYNALNSLAVGAVIPNISAKSLEKLIVPLPSIEKQNQVANRYQEKLTEIKVLKRKIQKAKDDLHEIFEKE